MITRRTFLKTFKNCSLACAGLAICPFFLRSRNSHAAKPQKGVIGRKLSPYFSHVENQNVRCELCPHLCVINKGDRGLCGVRENSKGQLYSLVYGNPCAINIDPIEKKSFYHVLPGTKTLSLATAGCNLDCNFCQNWQMSRARPEETYNYTISPDEAIHQAQNFGCGSIAMSYVEPVVFMEYMLDICRSPHESPLLKIMHSAGFVNRKPLDDLSKHLDAACIDLKGFSENFYKTMTGGSLKPVLNSLEHLHTRGIHTEIVTLLIPGKNDDKKRLKAMCKWIYKTLGPEVPLHFIRFYPRYKLNRLPPTSISALEQARQLAMEEGLHYVYIGNIPEHPAAHTYCPNCKNILIKRIGYIVKNLELKDGVCNYCGHSIPGIWKNQS